jgi:hypothetical protein
MVPNITIPCSFIVRDYTVHIFSSLIRHPDSGHVIQIKDKNGPGGASDGPDECPSLLCLFCEILVMN